MPLPVCLYQVGDAPASFAERCGNYVTWFSRLAAPHGIALEVVDGTQAPAPAFDVGGYAGIVVTGSPASLAQPEPWMDAAITLVKDAYTTGTPLLGVCFGHQLIGAAIGGTIVANPQGWEVSSCDVAISGDGLGDPLFHGVSEIFSANMCHQDIINPDSWPVLDDVRVLAGNHKATIQAIALGDSIRGVQFHPEFDGQTIREYIRHRRDEFDADAAARGDGHSRAEALLSRAQDCPSAVLVFDNFIRHFIMGR